MKKNIAMRLASGIMLASLLSTCVISGTFAKYTTNDTATDSARVAKWGVNVTASDVMFAQTYGDTVATSTTEKVVAPGTNGALATITVTGTPEVAVEVTYDADLILTGWTTTGSDVYCPLVFTVNGVEFKIDATNTDTGKLEEAIEAAIEGKRAVYAVKTDLAEVNDDLSVTWAWAFTGNDDAKDTILGNANPAPSIELRVTTTITQID